MKPDPSASPSPDQRLLMDIIGMKMPFGKYKGTVIRRLPISYLEWFAIRGFPKGRIGSLLQTLYEIKLNGLDGLLDYPGS